MSNYKEMYLEMVRAAEKANRILVEAQQKCEEIYISSPGPQLKVIIDKQNDSSNNKDK